MLNKQDQLKKLIIKRKIDLQTKKSIQDLFGYRLYVILRWIIVGLAALLVHLTAYINAEVFYPLPTPYGRTEIDFAEYIGWFLFSAGVAYVIILAIDKAVKYLFFYKYYYSSRNYL